jgi:hypothetical protein
MKTALRLGAVVALFVLLLVLASPGGGFRTPDVVLAAPDNNLTIRVTDPDPVADHQFLITRPGACGPANRTLSNGEFDSFTCVTDGNWTVTVNPQADRNLTGATCTWTDTESTTPAQQSAQLSLTGNVLTLSIVDDEDADCTFTFSGAPTTAVANVVIGANPTSIACGGTSLISAIARDSAGNPIVDSVVYEFTTDSGVLSDEDAVAGEVTLTLAPDDADAVVTVTVNGVTASLTVENDCAPLSIFASPAYLPCGGGTTNLTAVLRDTDGNVIPDVVYTWSVSSGVSLDVGAPNTPAAVDGTAVLFIPSATTSATVTVQVGDETETVTIPQVCGKVAIAVTADPNVIPCGGTTNLTATARDDNGHILEGLQWHWETLEGQLYVGPPNTADQVDNRATLTLIPGMISSVVTAWVGNFTDAPGQVTVQQFCPFVDTDGSGAEGAIQLSASTVVAGCGEAVFIGARVRDSKNQVPAPLYEGDRGRDIRFIASAGAFQTEAGVRTTYSGETTNQELVTVSQYNTQTDLNGVTNLTYLAPLYGGEVQITAASGDKFGKLLLKINCAAPPPVAVAATGGSTGGGGQAPCTPIGDGVCIRAPSTGISIRPPNTGDAGIK